MKTYIIGLFVVIAIIFTGCNSGQKKDNQNSRDKHEHVDGDGHDHSNEKDHDHSDDDGHDHAKDGNHSEDDGHGHGKESGSIEEIVFSKEQAKLVGLTTEAVSPGTFYQAIKTSGQIQASQGNEVVIAATSNGIVSFTNPSITDGTAINAGQSVVTISAKKLLEGDPAAKAKIAYDIALKEYQRAEGLVKDQIISAKDFEQSKLRYETAKTAYEAQASNITASGISVTSPISGYIKNYCCPIKPKDG